MGKRMRKKGRSIMALVLSTAMVFSSTSKAFAEEFKEQSKTTTYRTVMEVEDFGPQITKVIVDLGETVDKDTVYTDTFNVHVVRIPNSESKPILSDAEGDRKVTKAYISDENGSVVSKGNYATLEMEIAPDISLGLAVNFDMSAYHNEWIKSDYTITQQKDIVSGSTTVTGLIANKFDGEIRVLLDDFTTSQGTYDNITLNYASYAPTKDGEKHPLIIWLHGMGEGGTDGLLGIAGNKGVNFASKEMQEYFDGAYVLGPQTPTYWMEGTDGGFGNGTSKYETALMELIKDYVAKNPEIDTNRIYIGGDSNGGYMTMLMARDYSSYFAAAFPTCEALKDALITDSDIDKLKDLPMWFIAAKTDTTVPVNDYVIPTYNRLVEAGAKNVHLSLFDNVVDTSGLYKKEDGTPYEYDGHWSWIYVFNNIPTNTINGENTTLMQWLSEQSKEKSTTYHTVMEVEDFGPQITKVIVDLGKTVDKDTVDTDTFKVHVVRIPNSESKPILGDAEGDRKVTKAYISDKDGNVVEKGNYVTLEMEIAPNLSLGLPLNPDMSVYHNEWIKSDYTITQQKDITSGSTIITGLVANKLDRETRVLIDKFTTSEATYDNITLNYASYAPAKDGEKHPLIIWLHGMGEGGNDGLLGIAGNKGVNFASEEMQEYFGGAYVLGPQTPTFWMEGTTGKFGDGTSKYETALMALIKDYVAKNPDIDTNRIYIGGDSNGGYMTMLMARDYTSYFAAAFPTCEALKDSLITDSDIDKLKDLPMWFIAAKTDTTVPVKDYVIPTYNRLVKAGAKNVHLSLFDNVVDTSGLYKKADGTPYEYDGHWSWIYVFNNIPTDTIDGEKVSIMEWLSKQSLNKTPATQTPEPEQQIPSTQSTPEQTKPSTTSETKTSTTVTAPNTGDTTEVAPFILLMLSSVVGLYFTVRRSSAR